MRSYPQLFVHGAAVVPVFHCHLGGVYIPHALESLLWPLLITNQASMRTVQIGVAMPQHAEVMSWNLILAGVTIVLIPSFVPLAFGVKQLVRGITAGALKG